MKASSYVLLPIGAVEQHGPFLPLGTDLIITERVAESIASQVNLVVAPTLPVSASDTHLGFPGTLSMGRSALRETVERLCLQLRGHDDLGRKHGKAGFEKVFILSAHGGNLPVFDELAGCEGVHALPGWWDLAETKEVIGRFRILEGAHADEAEMSLLLYYGYPVVSPQLPFEVPEGSNDSGLDRPDTRAISASGILAPGIHSPSAQWGRALHDAAIRGYVRLLQDSGVGPRSMGNALDGQ
jgi:creatinine amidohydrolase